VKKESKVLLNQFNSVESLIQGAGKLTKVNVGLQGFVKGDGANIFKTLTQDAVGRTARGGHVLKDGTTLFSPPLKTNFKRFYNLREVQKIFLK